MRRTIDGVLPTLSADRPLSPGGSWNPSQEPPLVDATSPKNASMIRLGHHLRPLHPPTPVAGDHHGHLPPGGIRKMVFGLIVRRSPSIATRPSLSDSITTSAGRQSASLQHDWPSASL